MKYLLILSVLLATTASAYELAGKVVYVTDGDTITLLVDREQHKIRLLGIDAPERKQPYGSKSTAMLSAMIKGKQITADCTKKDRYKRDLCTLYLDGLDINSKMVRLGGAWVYRKYYKSGPYYALEAEAQAAKRGLWHTSEYQDIAPWGWRKQRRNK
ncbi:thermonuclease family protein [Cardiobacteriaceae bacterium TAE3-ERU3]|nr:thermonuclease family protein [Cardiobacteriaceae bacterium TAE3-ERU3]